MISISEFEKKYIQAIQQGNAAIFAGAGIGHDAGFVNWKELLRTIALSINLDVDRETDLVEVAQYYKNETGTRTGINTQILNEFLREAKPTPTLTLLATMPIDTYWTTNYDHLIEDELKTAKKTVDTKITTEALSLSVETADVSLYKMHGDYLDPSHCVLTKDDYESYNQTRSAFTTTLQGHLITKTFLFIGFSFDDPNLKYILSRIRSVLGENVRTHYCFIKKKHREKGQKRQEFEYEVNKQNLRIRDLQRYGIQAVMIDNYDQIPMILAHIKLQAKTKNIFISGAAHVYGADWDKKGIALINSLTQMLYDQNYRIVTGHARGIGSYIISKILSNVWSSTRLLDSHLLIRAFPYEDKNNPSYERLKKEYRDSIAEIAGVSIFMFGNKDNGAGGWELATGMKAEFEAAKRAQNYIIPVGSTGYVAKEIYDEVLATRDKYPYLTDQDLKVLGACTDVNKLVAQIHSILLHIKEY